MIEKKKRIDKNMENNLKEITLDIREENLFVHKVQFIPYDRTLEIYFVGCRNNCKGCHNPELHNITSKNSRVVTPTELAIECSAYVDIAKSVQFLGGEPLEQCSEALKELAILLREYGFKNIFLFTGRVIEEKYINKNHHIFGLFDFVKTGRYDENKLNTDKIKCPLTGIELISTNQKIYKVE